MHQNFWLTVNRVICSVSSMFYVSSLSLIPNMGSSLSLHENVAYRRLTQLKS
ncbi:hypothetical protein LMG28614_06294 [Paraburkholderia ultramafica]|uniref:Uncharacterized protein n=1 Tax=Paraburkholderia ultramafica TaxID=1544867 RepID=A0A6S7D423_9BURK|nr:hypothetical protein LMG28614_06294 [Paraburkholderia ultramafica]